MKVFVRSTADNIIQINAFCSTRKFCKLSILSDRRRSQVTCLLAWREDITGVAGVALATLFYICVYISDHIDSLLDNLPKYLLSGLLAIRPSGHPAIWPSGLLTIQFLDIWTSDLRTGLLIFGLLDIWTSGHLDFWSLDFWHSRLLVIWTSGLLDIWTYGLRTSGLLSPCPQIFLIGTF